MYVRSEKVRGLQERVDNGRVTPEETGGVHFDVGKGVRP